MPDTGPRSADGAEAKFPNTWEGGASPSQYVESSIVIGRATRAPLKGLRGATKAVATDATHRRRNVRGAILQLLNEDRVDQCAPPSPPLDLASPFAPI